MLLALEIRVWHLHRRLVSFVVENLVKTKTYARSIVNFGFNDFFQAGRCLRLVRKHHIDMSVGYT